jgi:G-protein alpha subunit
LRHAPFSFSGQSESGKSTTIKNFQLQYAPLSFWAERGTWKNVIHLNVVRSVRRIHDALSSLPLSESLTPDISPHPSNAYGTDEDYELTDNQSIQASRPTLSSNHRVLLMRLRPILNLDATLMHQLMWSDSGHSTDKSGLHAVGLFAPSPSSSLPTASPPSWWGKEVPDDPAVWPSARGTPGFSLTLGISAH